MSKMIPLCGRNGKGKFALVDDDIFEELNQYKWHFVQGYASRTTQRDGKTIHIRMHWHVLRLQPGFVGDHINGNRLDNRRSNLRACSRADNNKNKIGPLKPTSSKFKGVCWRPHTNAWKAYIKLDGKQRHLGYFQSEQDAAKAYDLAARQLFGEFARLNLPNDTKSKVQKRDMFRGENRWNARLTAQQVIEIRSRYAQGGISQQALANEYGVNRGTVGNVIRGATWGHLENE